jgi:hypothetical protein
VLERALSLLTFCKVTQFTAAGETAVGVTVVVKMGRGISGSAQKLRQIVIQQRTRRIHFLGRFHKKQLIAMSCHVRPSVHSFEQLSSHWTDFHNLILQ